MLNDEQKIKSSRRLHLDVTKISIVNWHEEKSCNRLLILSQNTTGFSTTSCRKRIKRYDRVKNLQATSHLWVRMHFLLGFRVVLHVPFSFVIVLQQFVV